MELAVLWIAFSIAAGIIAANKGRSGWGYFFLSVLLSPLIGILFALIAQPLNQPDAQSVQPTPQTHQRCPDCREYILIGARVCKHCGCRIKANAAAADIPVARCPVCSITVPATTNACPKCGLVLRD